MSEEIEYLVTCVQTKKLVTSMQIVVEASSFYEAIEKAKNGETTNWWGDDTVIEDSIVIDEKYEAEVR